MATAVHAASNDGAAFGTTTPTAQRRKAEKLAKALGWFSIGLGLAQVIAPERMNEICGVDPDDENCRLMRGLGLREITTGLGILSQQQPTAWMWGRVAGDAMDLALLGSAMTSNGTDRVRTIGATAAVLGVAMLDVACVQQLTQTNGNGASMEHATQTDIARREQEADELGVKRVVRAVTICHPVEVVRSAWNDFRADTANDIPDGVSTQFRAAAGDRGTEVVAELWLDKPNKIVAVVEKLAHKDPGQQLGHRLREFKQIMETGEIVLSDATLERGKPHPAQPHADWETTE